MATVMRHTGLMTDDSQTREGAGVPIVDLLNLKQKMRVGCWNVQTLYHTGKVPQLVKDFDNYILDILGISEARWSGAGKRRLASGVRTHRYILGKIR
jgi:hypothetical protein